MFSLKTALTEISNFKEFTQTKKLWNGEEFSVISYNVETADTFVNSDGNANSIRLNLRGTCFSESGECIRLPFEKFFNVGQKHFTQLDVLQNEPIKQVLNKLDASMVAPLLVNGEIFWGSKRCSDEFNVRIKNSGIAESVTAFVFEMLNSGKTPIFEYYDPNFESTNIVLQYPERFLKLLAVRDIQTGEYHDISNFNVAKTEIVKTNSTLKQIVETVQNSEGSEGVVVEFENGLRVKIKSFWYLARHKLVDLFRTPWMLRKLYVEFLLENPNVEPTVERILLWNPEFDGCGDDVYSSSTKQQRQNFDMHVEIVHSNVLRLVDVIAKKIKSHESKKDLGLSEDFPFKNVAFRCFNSSEHVERVLLEQMLKSFSSTKNNRLYDCAMNNISDIKV